MANNIDTPRKRAVDTLDLPILNFSAATTLLLNDSNNNVTAAVNSSVVYLVADIDCYISVNTIANAAVVGTRTKLPADTPLMLGVESNHQVGAVQVGATAGNLFVVPAQTVG